MKMSDVRISERVTDEQGGRGDKGGRYREVGNDKRKGFRDRNFVEISGNTEVSERVASWRSGREDRG
jgi:hypothetical protein